MLDGGALGIIAPHIRSAAEAAAVVRCAKYPPLGERSAGGPLPQYQYRDFPAAEANRAANDATMVIAMMETATPLKGWRRSPRVDGIDMLFIGTNDLCGELGIHGAYDHKLVREAYTRTIAACRARASMSGSAVWRRALIWWRRSSSRARATFRSAPISRSC